ncbi:MAG TPA: ferrous iron transport protein A, partial [Planctomycetota bacterium]|nr:ferrous iron transport protein A [Planctomycetota bacterium]
LAAPLAYAATQAWHHVVDIVEQPGSTKRLMDLGLTPGSRVFVSSVSANGVVLHLAGNLRLAVDASLAQMVWVEPVAA